MWNRREIKKKARVTLKRHYWRMVVICLIAAYIAGAYSMSNATTLLSSYDSTKEDSEVVFPNIKDSQKSNTDVVNELIGKEHEPKPSESSPKYTRGVFSAIFNNVTKSGSVLFGVLNVFNQFIFHDQILFGLVILFGTLIMILYWLFVQNILVVGQCRYFLEASSYKEVSMRRMLMMIQVRKWWNVTKVMFFTWLYNFLWYLTIVGGVIKSYSYLMVPFIVAENPGIKKKEAITLSREMMHGNKWRAFVLDASFIGWNLLSVLSGGLIGIFFSNAYSTSARTELYLHLREKAIADKMLYFECLNDPYIGLTPVIPEGLAELPDEYPAYLFSIPEHERRHWIKVDYRRNYSIPSIILLFFTFSLIGWLWEVSLHLSTEGFVNRGVLHGPWLPIYGSGGVLVLILLKKVREHPIVTFFMTVLICGVLEYGTSLFLEITKGKKWWDYSGYLLNIDGRVCAEGLLVFGLGGCAFIYFAAPLFDELYKKIPAKIQILLCVGLLSVFAVDQAYSHKHPNEGKGITDYESYLDLQEEAELVYLKNKETPYVIKV